MIKKQFLFPECYINKVPYCDKCKVQLLNTNTELLTSPPIKIFQCPKCKEKYNIRADELQGEWKWKTI